MEQLEKIIETYIKNNKESKLWQLSFNNSGELS